jgi:hypothetical protein
MYMPPHALPRTLRDLLQLLLLQLLPPPPPPPPPPPLRHLQRHSAAESLFKELHARRLFKGYMCVCVYVYTHTHTCIHTHTHTHARTHARMHTHSKRALLLSVYVRTYHSGLYFRRQWALSTAASKH